MNDIKIPTTEEALVTPPEIMPTASGSRYYTGILAGILFVLAGIAVIFWASALDYQDISEKPWNSAFILFDIPEGMPDLESYPIKARRVSRPDPLEEDLTFKLLEQAVSWERFDQPLRLSDPELLIAIDIPQDIQEELLASGRLPDPREPEVLAGSLARDEDFEVDGITFKVTGRLANSVSGFLFAYMLPNPHGFENLFPDDPQTASGLLVVPGDILLKEGLLPENPHFATIEENLVQETDPVTTAIPIPEEENTEDTDAFIAVPPFTGGMLLSRVIVAKLAIFGLLLTALGGAIAHYSLFQLLHFHRYRLLFPFLDMIFKRPTLYWTMHIALYGIFFFSMYESINNPLLTYRVSQYIQAVFSQGGLGYIGEAYASGDVIRAAWATYYNNYIEQTLGLTFLISLFPIPIGLLKNLASFSLVGGALAPLWAGTSSAYVLHCITMILELQAYIIACFAITAWPLHLIRGIRNHQFVIHIKSGLTMLFCATLFTGIMLWVAALYEAFTLIYLMTP